MLQATVVVIVIVQYVDESQLSIIRWVEGRKCVRTGRTAVQFTTKVLSPETVDEHGGPYAKGKEPVKR